MSGTRPLRASTLAARPLQRSCTRTYRTITRHLSLRSTELRLFVTKGNSRSALQAHAAGAHDNAATWQRLSGCCSGRCCGSRRVVGAAGCAHCIFFHLPAPCFITPFSKACSSAAVHILLGLGFASGRLFNLGAAAYGESLVNSLGVSSPWRAWACPTSSASTVGGSLSMPPPPPFPSSPSPPLPPSLSLSPVVWRALCALCALSRCPAAPSASA